MRATLAALFFIPLAAVAAAPKAIPTFHSLGLYWSPDEGAESKAAKVRFREAGASSWREGLELWFDARNGEYRGSLVELKPGTQYEIQLRIEGRSETLKARTWSETFKVKRTVQVAPGTTHLVIERSDSGSAEEGYVVFTAPKGKNVIDQSEVAGNNLVKDSCVIVRQGVHHVIIRGLVLKDCKRAGVLLDRQFEPVLEAQTHDIVIEDNEVSGWGGLGNNKPNSDVIDNDGAVQCSYWREKDDAKRPDRIVIQRNVMRDPRHGSRPWRIGADRKHPMGANGVIFANCGSNHVIRYNDIYARNGNHFMDGLGGADNFSLAGFPWADSDIYGNRISDAYDDGIEAEGANRNVRIWSNYLDRVFVPIANAATAVGPLYVWRNVSNRVAGMYQPDADPDREQRGPFIKAGSNHAQFNGGRAYYFHNTVLQPSGKGRFPAGAGWGILNSGGKAFNIVTRNNIWHIHNEVHVHGQPKFYALMVDADRGPVDADYDLYNGRLGNLGRDAERNGWQATPVFDRGNLTLKPGSPGHGRAVRIPNFNDQYAKPDVGAQQSGAPALRFGASPSSASPVDGLAHVSR